MQLPLVKAARKGCWTPLLHAQGKADHNKSTEGVAEADVPNKSVAFRRPVNVVEPVTHAGSYSLIIL